MAITRQNDGSGDALSGNNVDVTITVETDTDYIVAMTGSADGDGDDFNAVTFDPGGADEATFTQQIDKANTGRADNPEAAIWYLLDVDIPDVGSSTNYTVRLSRNSGSGGGMGVQVLTGAAQQAPEATAFQDTNGVGSITVSGTTDGAMVFDVFCTSAPEEETDDEGQKIFAVEPGGSTTIAGSWESSTGGDVTCSWSFTSSAPGVHVAASIAPAATATTVSNDRLADMAFCRGRMRFGPGRLPIPDGTID